MMLTGATIWFISLDGLYEGRCVSYVSKPNPFYGDQTPFYIVEVTKVLTRGRLGHMLTLGSCHNINECSIFTSLNQAYEALYKHMIKYEKCLIAHYLNTIDRCEQNIKAYEEKIKEMEDER